MTCGWSHTVALSQAGDVYTWGNGDHGKLGHGNEIKLTRPELVSELHGKGVCKVASYNEHTAALTGTDRPSESVLVSDMRSLVNDSTYADVVFVVEGHYLYAHRAILAARSEHFRNMFASGMRESKEKQINIPEIRFNVFKALLEFLYTNQADVDGELAIQLYSCADLYRIERLKELCEMKVRTGITVENAPFLLKVADELSNTLLREICVRFIISHFDTVSKCDSFKVLNMELVHEILQNR